MANLGFVHCFVLLLAFSVIASIPRIDAEDVKICSEVLHPTDCTLESCGSECLTKRNGKGTCENTDPTNPTPTPKNYKCVCYYRCKNFYQI
ncbi:hypothetical protein ACHQM5_001227 [Ranunculus cassubicifolius]